MGSASTGRSRRSATREGPGTRTRCGCDSFGGRKRTIEAADEVGRGESDRQHRPPERSVAGGDGVVSGRVRFRNPTPDVAGGDSRGHAGLVFQAGATSAGGGCERSERRRQASWPTGGRGMGTARSTIVRRAAPATHTPRRIDVFPTPLINDTLQPENSPGESHQGVIGLHPEG